MPSSRRSCSRYQVSSIVCTLDRGPDVALTIESLLGQDLPREGYEILIVDNGSTEVNAAVLIALADAHPDRVRYVREDRIGESSARNCALREARGEILAFLDDDAIAAPGWLGAIAGAFDADPELGAVGGKVVLRYLAPRPDWLDESLVPYLSAFDLGEERRRLSYMDYPRGANMAFRRAVFAAAGPFSERFGRKGTCLSSCSEIEMCYRIERAGWGIEYLPLASVEHLVPAARLRQAWFASRIYWQGRSVGLMELVHFGRLHALGKLPGHLARLCTRGRLHRRLDLGYAIAVPLALFTSTAAERSWVTRATARGRGGP